MSATESDKTNLSRRRFMKVAAVAAIATGGVRIAGSFIDRKKEREDDHAVPAVSKKTSGGKMTYRRTLSTGDSVSLLGFGCMRFPVRRDEKGEEVLDQDKIDALIDSALAGGVNYFDTSPVYCKGRSEEALGKALRRHPRDSYFIATKLSNFASSAQSRQKSIEMFETSLRKLQTDYVDYLLLHAIGQGGMDAYNARYEANGMLDYLIAQREKGRVRNLGFSYHGDVEVFDYMLAMHDEGRVRWDFAQIQLNYIDWNHAKEVNRRNTDANYLYDELERRGIPVVVMEPLLGGRLAEANRYITGQMKRRCPDNSVASWAFRFAGSKEGILTVLSGMTYMEHLQDNLATYSPLVPLSDEEYAFLEDTAQNMLAHPLIGCTDCKYCMPCPYGVDIPAVFSHYNKCVNDNMVVAADTHHSRYAEARRAFLSDIDRSVPRSRQADHCIGCNECVSHCPQHIPIPVKMGELSRYTEYLRSNPD